MTRFRQIGFTLIELMIAVAIVGILAAVALPAYRGQIIKSNRAVAQAQMMDIASRQPQYLVANRSYASKTQLETAGYVLPKELLSRYTFDVVTSTSPPSYTVTFRATGGQASDGDLTLTSDGVRSPANKW